MSYLLRPLQQGLRSEKTGVLVARDTPKRNRSPRSAMLSHAISDVCSTGYLTLGSCHSAVYLPKSILPISRKTKVLSPHLSCLRTAMLYLRGKPLGITSHLIMERKCPSLAMGYGRSLTMWLRTMSIMPLKPDFDSSTVHVVSTSLSPIGSRT